MYRIHADISVIYLAIEIAMRLGAAKVAGYGVLEQGALTFYISASGMVASGMVASVSGICGDLHGKVTGGNVGEGMRRTRELES